MIVYATKIIIPDPTLLFRPVEVSNHQHCEIEMYHFRDFARDVSLS